MERSEVVLEHMKRGSLFLLEVLKILGFILCVYAEKLFRVFVPRPLKSLEGEVILLTGAGNGIGKEIALKLAGVGATLVCWDVEGPANEETVAELKRKGSKAFAYTVDISNRETIRSVAQRVRDEVGDVTVIVNNAGISPVVGPFLETRAEDVERIFQVNLFAHFWIIREFLPKMISQNHGHIVSVASLSALVPCRNVAAYVASKHAVHGFIESLKQDLTKMPTKPNIHFTTVYPIFVQTRMIDGVILKPRFAREAPIMTPEYIARKTVEGFRRNYEHLCLPPLTVIFAFIRALAPAAIMRYLEGGLFHVDVERTVNAPNNYIGGKKIN